MLSEIIEEAGKATSPQHAIEIYRQFLLEKPQNLVYHAVVHFNLATMIESCGDQKTAEEHYRQSLHCMPGFWAPTINLANILSARGLVSEAISLFDRAIPVTTDDENRLLLWKNMGRIKEERGDLVGAIEAYASCLAIEPSHPGIFQHWIHCRQKICDWPLFNTIHPMSILDIAAQAGPLGVMALFDDPFLLLHASKSWISGHVSTPIPPPLRSHSYGHRAKGEKLRIGYISCDFRQHVVGFLVQDLFSTHNRDKFEVYGFDRSIDDKSAFRQRLLSTFDHVVPLHHMDEVSCAQAICNCEIDILIDMMGLTSGALPGIIARKPAPVQISYLGFLGPSGLDTMDYILCDRFVIPPESVAFYTEKPLYMPRCFQINYPWRTVQTMSRESCSLPSDVFVFCVHNNCYKMNPEMIARWCRILTRVPNSILWLLEWNETMRVNIKKECWKHGIGEDRLVFAPPVLPDIYLARFSCADLYLDCSPYNAGGTCADVIWSVPVLTCPGKTYVSRMAGSILKAMDLPELVVSSWLEYENAAVRYATHPEELAAVYRRLNRKSSFFDTTAFVKDWEVIIEKVADDHHL
jgi:predicted O-linked N-acetylglucosamine transferase (SPINDLY family)